MNSGDDALSLRDILIVVASVLAVLTLTAVLFVLARQRRRHPTMIATMTPSTAEVSSPPLTLSQLPYGQSL